METVLGVLLSLFIFWRGTVLSAAIAWREPFYPERDRYGEGLAFVGGLIQLAAIVCFFIFVVPGSNAAAFIIVGASLIVDVLAYVIEPIIVIFARKNE